MTTQAQGSVVGPASARSVLSASEPALRCSPRGLRGKVGVHARLPIAVGERYGRWVVVELNHRRPGSRSQHVLAKCDCGTTRTVSASALTNEKSTSCGCYCREQHTTHGRTNSKRYEAWSTMVGRCTRPTNVSWHRYGGRGIKVCERWMTFANFLADMGERPENMSLERIDNNGDYCPENCRWATSAQQNRNKRTNVYLTFHGRTQCVKDWSLETGLSSDVIHQRIQKGWEVDAALTTPSRKRQTKKATDSSRKPASASHQFSDTSPERRPGTESDTRCRSTRETNPAAQRQVGQLRGPIGLLTAAAHRRALVALAYSSVSGTPHLSPVLLLR